MYLVGYNYQYLNFKKIITSLQNINHALYINIVLLLHDVHIKKIQFKSNLLL